MKTKHLGTILTLAITFILSSCSEEPVDPNNTNNNNNNGGNNAELATIQTVDPQYIKSTSAFSGGNVTDDGGATVTKRGICWSTQPSPDINNDKTDDGTGKGKYITEIAGLTKNTTYYVRAYATNSAGTVYGNQVSFTTAEVDLEAILYGGNSIYIAPSSSAKQEWGPDKSTGVTTTTDGKVNTIALSQMSENYAAKVCADLDAWGYDDWYLPSQAELGSIRQQADVLTGWDGNDGTAYWSSSEKDATTAYGETFSTGNTQKEYSKTTKMSCRCVRKDD